jgi:excisionase family DNA binding protein
MQEEVFTLEEAAKYLKVHQQTIYKMARAGKLPGMKIGRSWRFHKDILDAMLKGEPVHSIKKQ